MSATNRGSERHPSDFYETPASAINEFLNHYNIKVGSILDPAAGSGAFGKSILESDKLFLVDAVEIMKERKESLEDIYNGEVHIADFLTWEPECKYDTIITNPPYSLAIQYLQKCFEISKENTEIIMLLRLAFLESKKRHAFWQEHPVNKLYVLSDRPSFTNDGHTDATAYCWMVWDNSNEQNIYVI